MLTLSFSSLCLKDNGCSTPSPPQARDDEFDTDLEADGKYNWITSNIVWCFSCCCCSASRFISFFANTLLPNVYNPFFFGIYIYIQKNWRKMKKKRMTLRHL